MCLLGRDRRTNYEGRDKSRGMETTHSRGLSQNQTDRPLKINQTGSGKESKFLGLLEVVSAHGSPLLFPFTNVLSCHVGPHPFKVVNLTED